MGKKLTAKQKAFVNEYLVDLNGAEAARRAGYSEKGSNVRAFTLLSQPHIQEAVASAMKAREERTEITQDWVLERLRREAETAETDSARVRATELIGKHLGMFTNKHEFSGPNGQPLNPPEITVNFVEPQSDEADAGD